MAGSDGSGTVESTGPLALEGWLEFNRRKWGVRPLRVSYAPAGKRLPAIEAVLYLNKRGRIVLPLRNPYVSLRFRGTSTTSRPKRYRQWLAAADVLAADWRQRGLGGLIALPPSVTDVRPLQWAGFRISVRYTFQLELPADLDAADHATRKNVNKARAAGYVCRRTEDMGEVTPCLEDTERRQSFNHHLDPRDLELARELLGPERMTAYVCQAADGEPASARVVLRAPGAHALDWLAGTRTPHLASGAAQLVMRYALEDLAGAAVPAIDLAGANMERLAAAKMKWGGRLRPYYLLRCYSLQNLVRWLGEWRKSNRTPCEL